MKKNLSLSLSKSVCLSDCLSVLLSMASHFYFLAISFHMVINRLYFFFCIHECEIRGDTLTARGYRQLPRLLAAFSLIYI